MTVCRNAGAEGDQNPTGYPSAGGNVAALQFSYVLFHDKPKTVKALSAILPLLGNLGTVPQVVPKIHH
jgi:hypothetical protein